MKTFFLFLCIGLVCSAIADDKNGALANLRSLPPEYRHGVLKLSADNCDPNPDLWYLVARSDGKKGRIQQLEMASGQIVSSKAALGIREVLGSEKPIDIDKIEFDSRDAFDLAQSLARANNKTIGSVSFVLTQQGSSAAPIWHVWCYAPNEACFGQLQILATDGTVISNDAFPKKP